MNFTDLNNNGAVDGFCLVKTADRKITAKGVPYLDMVLTDSSGEIGGKLWDFKEEQHGWIDVNVLVRVRGTISQFNESNQLRVEKIRKVTPEDDVRVEDFVPCAPYRGEDMLDEILTVADGFKSAELRELVRAALAERREKLLYWPAAFKLHHAVRGGLLYHTLTILKLAQRVCEVYPFVDKDLLYSGVILHDIAKTEEFEASETGVAKGYSADGTLVGHLVRGAMLVERIGRGLGVADETLMLVEHMLISHHGEPEYGAAVRPMFLEAELLSELDLMDSRVYEMAMAAEAVQKGEFTPRQWALDNRKLYNHGRVGAAVRAEIL